MNFFVSDISDLPNWESFGYKKVLIWYAGIAQLVEQRIRNAWVVGSNPIPGSLCHLSYYEVPYLLANIQKGGYRF